MTGGGGVARLDRRDRRRDEPFEQPLDVLVQPAVLDGHRRLRRERAHELDGALVVRQHLAVHHLRRRQLGVGVALAIDELQHADDLVAVRLHRNDEHRLGAIAELLVERAILLVRDVVGEQVDVGDHERLARRRGVPGEAGMVDRDGALGERQRGQREVLRELEAKRVRRPATLGAFRDVHRAGVARRDAARLGEDHLEQREEIALGRERDADVGQLRQLSMARLFLGHRLPFRRERHGMAESAAQHRHHRPDRRIPRQIAGQKIEGKVGRRLRFTRIAQRHDRRVARQIANALAVRAAE